MTTQYYEYATILGQENWEIGVASHLIDDNTIELFFYIISPDNQYPCTIGGDSFNNCITVSGFDTNIYKPTLYEYSTSGYYEVDSSYFEKTSTSFSIKSNAQDSAPFVLKSYLWGNYNYLYFNQTAHQGWVTLRIVDSTNQSFINQDYLTITVNQAQYVCSWTPDETQDPTGTGIVVNDPEDRSKLEWTVFSPYTIYPPTISIPIYSNEPTNGIKTNEIIKATELNALKAAIQTLYNNRPLITDSQKNYCKNVFNSTFFKKNEHNWENFEDLINACLVINDIPNLKFINLDSNSADEYVHLNEKIFSDGTNTDLLTWVNSYKDRKNTDIDHGCRAACMGICFNGCTGTATGTAGQSSGNQGQQPGCGAKNCSGKCQDACDTTCESACKSRCSETCTLECGGISDGGAAAHSCGNYCVAKCDGGCMKGCSGSCIDYCYGGCIGKCHGSCTGYCVSCNYQCKETCSSCSGLCGSGCAGVCGGSCTGCGSDCAGTCYQGCSGSCDDLCINQCFLDCTNGCYGKAAGGCYGCSTSCAGKTTST